MTFWIIASIILLIICVILGLRMASISFSLTSIASNLGDIISSSSNTLLSVEGGEKCVRRLASELNVELETMRKLKNEYQKGNVALSKTAENMAHDLRTPLTAIKGYLELLEKEELGEEGKEYLSVIKGRVDYMKDLTDELYLSLSMRKKDELLFEESDVKSILEEALISLLAQMEKKAIEPHLDLPDHKVTVRCDRKALFRVFSNIIENAIKYGMGDIKVEMDGGKVVFSNYAPSLDNVDAARLLFRYYTVEGGRASSGLGLNIAKDLMVAMGGGLEVKKDKDRLILTVLLPS